MLSVALGGYIAGRSRSTWRASPDEVHFRDGLHGLLAWSIAVILGAGLTWASAATINPTSKTNVAAPNTAANTTATEPSFLTFELDRLFRSANRQQTNNPEVRAEAGRILETGLGRKDLSKDDRDRLLQLVSAQTGLSATDADHRVGQIISESRSAAAKARQSVVIIAFTAAAALAAGGSRCVGLSRDWWPSPRRKHCSVNALCLGELETSYSSVNERDVRFVPKADIGSSIDYRTRSHLDIAGLSVGT